MPREDSRENTTSNKPSRGGRYLGEEECHDKVCSETKKGFQKWLSERQKKADESDCPLDREQLGRNTWSLLHTMAAHYPMRPSAEDKSNMSEFIRLFSLLYPCSYCAQEFRTDLARLPPKLESRTALANWFCQMHNLVNVKLNKPEFDCSKVDERWRTGWKDGRCM